MSEYPRDEFDDVPEDGARQGAHRGHTPPPAPAPDESSVRSS